jgi:lactate dehydrogenase-like 2-hydroxyacid dehydrogenase
MANGTAEVVMLYSKPTIESALIEHGFTLHKATAASDREALLESIAPRVRAIVVCGGHDPVNAAIMGRFPKLEIVSCNGVGYDHIDVAWAAEHGVVVTHTPDVLTEEVADTALGLTLCTVRELPQAERYLRAGNWPKLGNYRLTASLRDRVVGIVGMGRIGKAIARRFDAMRVPVVYHEPVPVDVSYKHYPNLLDLAREVSLLIVITSGGPATKNLISREVLQALGPEGILINVSRGSVVDEQALISALQNKTILAAGLDVFAHEPNVPPQLLEMQNVVLFPHVGSASTATRAAMDALCVDNLVSWFRGTGPITPVPETPVGK